MSPHTIMLRKSTHFVKRQLESQQRQLEKTAAVKAGAYIVSIDTKITEYRLEACEIAFFENPCFSNAFPYFTDLSVS